jgi:hypothetical protein
MGRGPDWLMGVRITVWRCTPSRIGIITSSNLNIELEAVWGCCAEPAGTPNIARIAHTTIHAERQIAVARIAFPPAAFSDCGA